MGKLNINNGGVDTNKKMPDIDERFGPYSSTEAADAALGGQGRNTITAGLTVGILTANAGVKEYWYQPNKKTGLLELIPKGGNAVDNPTEGNFASFDENGNVVDSGNKADDFAPMEQAVPMGDEDDEGKILEKQKNGFGWVEKPVDGDDAYGVYVKQYDEQHPEDPNHESQDFMSRDQWLEYNRGKSAREIYNKEHNTSYTDAQFIEAIKANYPMKYVAYNATAYSATSPFDSIDSLDADETTEGKLWFMPNDDNTETKLFITVNNGTAESPSYKWYNMGVVNVPDNVLTEEMVDNECINGTVDTPASANFVMGLKAKLEGVTEEKVQIVSGTNFFDGFINGQTGRWEQSGSNKVLVLPVEGVKRVRFLGTTVQFADTYLGYAFGTLISGDTPDSTLSNFSPLEYCYAEYEHTGENVAKEYNLIVPEGATWLAVSYRTRYVAGKFYCYKQMQLDDEIFLHPSILVSDSYKSMDYNVLSDGNWGNNVAVKHALINVEGVKTITCRALTPSFNFAFLAKSIKPVSGEFSGAILLSNGNYRYDLSGGQQIDVSVPYGAKYLSFTLGDFTSVKGEFSLKYFTNSTKGLNKVDIPITLVGGSIGASTGASSVYYYISSEEYNKYCSKYIYEKLIAFNPLFDSITGFDADIANGTLTYHCFSENGRIYLGKTNDSAKMPIGTTHIRFELTFAEPQTVRKVNLTLYAILKNESYEIIKSYGPANKFMEFGTFGKFFSLEIVRPRIPSANDNGAVYYPDAQDRDYTNAYIYLPKGYSNVGKPSKVLLNFHGTSTFNLNQSALDEGQDLQRQFLAKCGYAVIDVCTDSYYTFVNYDYGTSASSGGYASNFPTPLAYECWSKVVEYCLDTYNLDSDNIFVLSKSAGGLNCINFINKFSGVRIKAAALSASSIDIFCNIRASYVWSINNFLMQIGCLNPNVHPMNIGVGAVNPEDKTYFEANEAKIQAYNPILAKMSNNFDAHQFMEAVLSGIYSSTNPNAGDDSPMYNNQELVAMIDDCSVHSDVPTKIWHAIDDDNVPFTQSKWYKEMCVRGGSHVELRSWPASNGRHYFDSFVSHDDGTGTTYTPTLIDYTTPFGEIVQTNPVYAEIVDWLNRW